MNTNKDKLVQEDSANPSSPVSLLIREWFHEHFMVHKTRIIYHSGINTHSYSGHEQFRDICIIHDVTNSGCSEVKHCTGFEQHVAELFRQYMNTRQTNLGFFEPVVVDEERCWYYTILKISKVSHGRPAELWVVSVSIDLNDDFEGHGKRIQLHHHYKHHQQKFMSLTRREKEVLALIVQGNKNPEVAEKLYISRHTVQQHRKKIIKKLGTNSVQDFQNFSEAFSLI